MGDDRLAHARIPEFGNVLGDFRRRGFGALRLEEGADLIGLATLQFPSPEYKLVAPAFISNFVIKKAFQGQGLGSYLFKQIERYCSEYGLRKIILESAATNMAFWQAVGFMRNIQNPTVLFKSIPAKQYQLSI